MTIPTTVDAQENAVVGKLSTLGRFLPVWIGVAMVVGLLLGRSVPGLGRSSPTPCVIPRARRTRPERTTS